MSQDNVFSVDRYPPTNALAAAIRHLPQPAAGVPPQAIEIDAGPIFGRYNVTFVVRLNTERGPQAGFWGVGSIRKIPDDRGHEGLVGPARQSCSNGSVMEHGSASAKLPASLVANGIFTRLQQIRAAVAPIIGLEGVTSLYERSLHLSSRRYPWLAVSEEGLERGMDLEALRLLVLEQNESEAAAGAGFLLKSFHDLLAGLVGTLLTRDLTGMPPAQFGSESA